jgi:hypothetical protein
VTVADIDIGRREPQIPLGELAGAIVGPLIGVGLQEQRAQLGDALLEDGDAALPADALGDDRRGHRGTVLQQLADLRLERVDGRRPPAAAIGRWIRAADRGAHRVARDVQPSCDRLDPHSFCKVQAANLCQVLHR